MPSVYLEPADYATYGVPDATDSQVIQASSIIDGYLNRKDGLIYQVDGSNNPINMAATGQPINVFLSASISGRIVLQNTPLVALLSVQYSSRCNTPPVFNTATQSTFDANSGIVFLDSVIPRRADLKISYIAGWLYTALPSAIKQACANLVAAISVSSAIGISGSISEFKQGDTQIKRFSGTAGNTSFTLLDDDIKNMLNPYRATFSA